MTDHKNEAIDRLEMVYLRGATDSERANGIAASQVHATLYLAEQQQLANVIAYQSSLAAIAMGTGRDDLNPMIGKLGNQIIEGLGLA